MHTDPIADMLTRLRNAHSARKHHVRIPYSKVKHAVLEVLAKNKFVEKLDMDTSGTFKEIEVTLRQREYPLEIQRISKPGQRIYVNVKEIPAVLNGLGICVLSTSKGVMSGLDAKKHKLGGELLCTIS